MPPFATESVAPVGIARQLLVPTVDVTEISSAISVADNNPCWLPQNTYTFSTPSTSDIAEADSLTFPHNDAYWPPHTRYSEEDNTRVTRLGRYPKSTTSTMDPHPTPTFTPVANSEPHQSSMTPSVTSSNTASAIATPTPTPSRDMITTTVVTPAPSLTTMLTTFTHPEWVSVTTTITPEPYTTVISRLYQPPFPTDYPNGTNSDDHTSSDTSSDPMIAVWVSMSVFMLVLLRSLCCCCCRHHRRNESTEIPGIRVQSSAQLEAARIVAEDAAYESSRPSEPVPIPKPTARRSGTRDDGVLLLASTAATPSISSTTRNNISGDGRTNENRRGGTTTTTTTMTATNTITPITADPTIETLPAYSLTAPSGSTRIPETEAPPPYSPTTVHTIPT